MDRGAIGATAWMLALVTCFACEDTSGPVLEPGEDGGRAGRDGAPAPDGGPLPDGALPPDIELSIAFVQPTGDLTVNNVVQGELATTGAPERVELLIRQVGDPSFELDRTLTAPYVFTQDLTVHADGTQLTLQGRATRGTVTAMSDVITITIDRSLPEEFYAIISRPDSGTVVDASATMHANVRGPARVGVTLPAIDAVEWLIDGVVEPALECTNGTWQTNRSCVVEWDTAAVDAGRYEVTARFVLSEGGTLTSPPIGLIVLHEGVNPAFDQLGTELAVPDSPAYDTHMSMDGAGRVVLTYRADTEVHARRWNTETGAFEPLGGPVATGPQSLWPRVAVDGMDRPVVTWTQETGGGSVTVRTARFEDGAWNALGEAFSSTFGSVGSQYSILAIDPTDQSPVVTWLDARDDGGERRIRTSVARWTGGAWDGIGIDLGGELPTTDYVAPSGLTVTEDGTPIVSYADASGPERTTTYLREYREGSWSTLDTVAGVEPSGNGGLTTDFARASDGTIYLATYHRLAGISVHRLEAGSFTAVGGPMTVPAIAGATVTYWEPYLALDTMDRPVVAFSSSLGGRAFRWTGSEWTMIGTGFLEDTLSTHGVRGLEIDDANRVYVVVGTGSSSGLTDILVKTHDL